MIFGQNSYSKGFNNGYQEGYCYNKGNCIAPITPTLRIGESLDRYKDGYNRGFELGLKEGQQSSNSSTRKRYETSQPRFVD